MLDLFIGYDNRTLVEESHNLTTFHTPFGLMCLIKLPMGWANSVPIFRNDVTYILCNKIPHLTIPFIDDIPVKDPEDAHRMPDGDFECCPENPGIRLFIRENFANLTRIVACIMHAGNTLNRWKLVLISAEIMVVGNCCTENGREAPVNRVFAISNWGPCRSLTEVRTFLGTVGVLHIFICNFTKCTWPLVQLTRKGVPFKWGNKQVKAQNNLKQAVLSSPALRVIDYTSDNPVILGVNTSHIAVGFFLVQKAPDHSKGRYLLVNG